MGGVYAISNRQLAVMATLVKEADEEKGEELLRKILDGQFIRMGATNSSTQEDVARLRELL